MKQQILTILGFLLSLFITPVFSSDDESDIPNASMQPHKVITVTSPGISADRIARLKIRSGQDTQFNINEIEVLNDSKSRITLNFDIINQAVATAMKTFNTSIVNDVKDMLPSIIVQSVPAKLINELFLDPKDNSLTQAKKFIRLGMNIRQADINEKDTNLPLSQAAKNNIAATCFNEACVKFDEFLNPNNNLKLSEYSFVEKIDLMISRAQMSIWVAHNISYIDNDSDPIQRCLKNLRICSIKYDHYEFVDEFVTNTKPIIMIYQAVNTINNNDIKILQNYFNKMTELQYMVKERLK